MKSTSRQRGSIVPRGRDSQGREVFLVRAYAGERAGKRHYEHETVHGPKREAKAALVALLHKVDSGLVLAPTKTTVRAFLTEWLKTIKRSIRWGTHESYTYLMEHYALPIIGERTVSSLRPIDVEAVYNAMADRKLSHRTIQYTHVVLRSAFQYAVERDYLVKNPVPRRPKLPAPSHREMQVLEPEHVEAFWKVAEKHHLYPLLALALQTGLRPSEFLALKWEDVDLEAGSLRVVRSLERKGKEWAFADVKRKKSRRTLRLADRVVEALRGHKARQAEIRLRNAEKWKAHDLVFTTIDGDPLRSSNVRIAFQGLLRKARLPHMRLYDLRHSAATLAFAAGISAKEVSEQLGHAGVSITLDTYTHVLPNMREDAATKVGAILFGAARKKRGAR